MKKVKIQTGIHYPSMIPMYEIQEICGECKRPIRIVPGEVDCEEPDHQRRVKLALKNEKKH